jgi:hypothetical protein
MSWKYHFLIHNLQIHIELALPAIQLKTRVCERKVFGEEHGEVHCEQLAFQLGAVRCLQRYME